MKMKCGDREREYFWIELQELFHFIFCCKLAITSYVKNKKYGEVNVSTDLSEVDYQV